MQDFDESVVDMSEADVSGESSLNKQKALKIQTHLREINKAFALSYYGDGLVILKTDDVPIRYLKKDAFLMAQADNTFFNGGGQPATKLGPLWLAWKKRRMYDDVVFFPGDTSDRNVYNLWKGFAYEPSDEGACDLFLDHLRANICDGQESHYEWMLDWMADAIQKPWRKCQTAVLLQSPEEGTGKGFFANTFGKLFGYHLGVYNKPKQLLGQFNSHLEDKLLVFLDEGSLVEKHAFDFAKSLISEPTLNIEPKNRSMREVKSYHRLIVASNDEQVLRASTHDRRWMVLRVAANSKNNLGYFDAIEEQMRCGGYAALMHMLVNRRYSEHTVKTTIKTDALNDQKDQNLPKHIEWWKLCLANEMIGESEWPFSISTNEFYKAYIFWCDQMNIRERETSYYLARKIRKSCGIEMKRKGGGRGHFYELPELPEARAAFDESMGYTTNWED